MSLPPGTRLGVFEIIGPLGAGGMGEVYRARDTKLGRDVAIKILPDAFARDEDRLARFEREARALAALNHPNIAQVYGFEGHALVMELLDGETLRDHLTGVAGAGVPVRKAVEYAQQIARGLAAAHERGIIHRDLKPENVFLLRDGQIKILDFGLARQVAPESTGATQTMTSLNPATDPGLVMGTVGYMSPEQVRGQALDPRTDLFALGCVLYELLTGERAFRRETAAETMTAILRADPPDFPPTRADINPALDRIVRHCLEKNPAERFQTARDVAFALNALSGSASTPAVPVPAVSPGKRRAAWLWPAVSAALAAIVVWQFSAARSTVAPSPPPVYRTSVALPTGFAEIDGAYPGIQIALAPDAQHIAVSGALPGQKQLLWIASLAGDAIRSIPGSDYALGPQWAPDSRRLAFVSNNSLRVSDLEGRMNRMVGPGITGSWGADDVILGGKVASPIWRVKAGGAPYEELIKLDGAERLGVPWFLPDGQHFLFRYRNPTQPAEDGIYVATQDGRGGRQRVLADSEWSNINVQYGSGALVYAKGSTVFAQRFDAEHLKVIGDPVMLVENVLTRNLQGSAYSVSANGVLAYLPNVGQSTSRLVWVARDGRVLSTVSDEADYSNVELSPDERHLLVSVGDQTLGGARDIYIVDLVRGVRQRLTFDPSDERAAVWSPDGRDVFYGSKGLNLYERSASFTGGETPVLVDGISKDPRQVSPDGSLLLYRASGIGTSNDIWVMPLRGGGKPRLVAGTPFSENYACFSPDGKAIVYASDETGDWQVFVTSIDGNGSKTQISTGGGIFPRWRRDGREILYLAPNNTLMSVPVTGAGATFHAGTEVALFRMDAQPGPGTPFDVTADGQRFLVNAAIQSKTPPAVDLVINWPSLLAAKRP